MKNFLILFLTFAISSLAFGDPSSLQDPSSSLSESSPFVLSLSSLDWDIWALSIMDQAGITKTQRLQLTPIFESYDNALTQALKDNEANQKTVESLSTDLATERKKTDDEIFGWKLIVGGETALIVALVAVEITSIFRR